MGLLVSLLSEASFWKKPLDISGAGLLRFSHAFQSQEGLVKMQILTQQVWNGA